MSDAPKTEKTDGGDPKAKSKLVPILAVVGVLVAGGGAGGYWMYSQPAAGGAEGEAHEEDAPEPGVVDLDPFVVNLADESGNRFLRVNMKLLTWDEEQALEVKENPVVSAKVRSAILELLSLQYAEPLVTPEGKDELKEVIAERATEAGGHGEHELKVTDVLFVEFVVQ